MLNKKRLGSFTGVFRRRAAFLRNVRKTSAKTIEKRQKTYKKRQLKRVRNVAQTRQKRSSSHAILPRIQNMRRNCTKIANS